MENRMNNKTIELQLPIFFSCLVALVFCTLLTARLPEPDHINEGNSISFEEAYMVEEENSTVLRPALFFSRTQQPRQDSILELYRQDENRERVINFFREICPIMGIAEVILANADEFNISPSLAFALSWEESRFNPRAVNTNNRNGSIDRGLFQLNSYTFPRLDLPAFFDPQTNAHYGMSHLRYCLDSSDSETAALAMYNAGTNRVRNIGTPITTLNYTGRILENRQRIEYRFLEQETRYQADIAALTMAESESEPERPLLSLLKPLGIR